jgi:hypothetical protein
MKLLRTAREIQIFAMKYGRVPCRSSVCKQIGYIAAEAIAQMAIDRRCTIHRDRYAYGYGSMNFHDYSHESLLYEARNKREEHQRILGLKSVCGFHYQINLEYNFDGFTKRQTIANKRLYIYDSKCKRIVDMDIKGKEEKRQLYNEMLKLVDRNEAPKYMNYDQDFEQEMIAYIFSGEKMCREPKLSKN